MSRSYDPGNGNIKVWMDQYSGKVLAKLDPKVDSGLTYQIWRLPLHTGTFGGVFTKILCDWWAYPIYFNVYWCDMWWYKKKNKRRGKRPRYLQRNYIIHIRVKI